MKFLKLNVMLVLVLAFVLSSCSVRLVDFTVISTKNAEIGVNKTKGVQTEGKKSYFLGMGLNLKDAIDIALENAGPQYDLLIDGVVLYKNLPFVTVVEVKGLAVSSSELRTQLGDEGFRDWCNKHNIFDASDTKNIKE